MRNTIKNIWHREREGSSLVTVIIGILFIAAIGTILLTIASRYLISVNVDHNASDNFYQTEGILEEVKTGLLEYAGDAGEEAYKDVVEHYTKTKDFVTHEKQERIAGVTVDVYEASETNYSEDNRIVHLQSSKGA